MARATGVQARGYVLLPHGVAAEGLAAGLRVLSGAHPVPDTQGLAASAEIFQAVENLGEGQHLLFLLSGGTSSLFEVPREGVSEQHLIETYRRLLLGGEPIEAVNRGRSQLSAVKSGGLARAATPAVITTLAVSDVAGDDPAVIGSGPSYQRGAVGARERFRVVASGRHAAAAAREHLAERGYEIADVPEELLYGDVADAAARISEMIEKMLGSSRAVAAVAAGETTVRVSGTPGAGGRCTHLALRLAQVLEGAGSFACVVAGTDGRDGSCDAAGALIDQTTAQRVRRAGADATAALTAFDSLSALRACGDDLVTGDTGTNVGDLLVVTIGDSPHTQV